MFDRTATNIAFNQLWLDQSHSATNKAHLAKLFG